MDAMGNSESAAGIENQPTSLNILAQDGRYAAKPVESEYALSGRHAAMPVVSEYVLSGRHAANPVASEYVLNMNCKSPVKSIEEDASDELRGGVAEVGGQSASQATPPNPNIGTPLTKQQFRVLLAGIPEGQIVRPSLVGGVLRLLAAEGDFGIRTAHESMSNHSVTGSLSESSDSSQPEGEQLRQIGKNAFIYEAARHSSSNTSNSGSITSPSSVTAAAIGSQSSASELQHEAVEFTAISSLSADSVASVSLREITAASHAPSNTSQAISEKEDIRTAQPSDSVAQLNPESTSNGLLTAQLNSASDASLTTARAASRATSKTSIATALPESTSNGLLTAQMNSASDASLATARAASRYTSESSVVTAVSELVDIDSLITAIGSESSEILTALLNSASDVATALPESVLDLYAVVTAIGSCCTAIADKSEVEFTATEAIESTSSSSIMTALPDEEDKKNPVLAASNSN